MDFFRPLGDQQQWPWHFLTSNKYKEYICQCDPGPPRAFPTYVHSGLSLPWPSVHSHKRGHVELRVSLGSPEKDRQVFGDRYFCT